MKAIQVHAKGEPMKLVEIPVPQPKAGQVLIQVEACGTSVMVIPKLLRGGHQSIPVFRDMKLLVSLPN